MANGDSDSGGEEARTPKDEKMDIDEPGSGAGGRSTRGELSLRYQFFYNILLIHCYLRPSSSSPPATTFPT